MAKLIIAGAGILVFALLFAFAIPVMEDPTEYITLYAIAQECSAFAQSGAQAFMGIQQICLVAGVLFYLMIAIVVIGIVMIIIGKKRG